MKVFISHSSHDKKFVRTLKSDLNENGIDTFFDEDSLELGDSLREKLEEALDKSSHFLIILSDNSVKSEWVQFELKEALTLFNKKTLSKIIPLKYRTCDIPGTLNNLLYGDLSEEIVKVDNEKVVFLSAGYETFLIKLIKTLKSSEKQLNKTDKTGIKRDTQQTEINIEKGFENQLILKHQILNFKDAESVKKYRAIASKDLPPHGLIKIHPVVLPYMYKSIIKGLGKGNRIKFISRDNRSITCYSAGFRFGQSYIVIPQAVRDFLTVTVNQEYDFKVDIKNKTFKLL